MGAEIDLQFLGEQMRRMQVDMRQLRSEQLRLEADQAAIRAEMAAGFAAIDTRIDRLERAIDAQFEQTHRTMATNLAVILEALKARPAGT